MVSSLLLSVALSQQASWNVNVNNTLMWQGKPYIPIGASINGTVDNVKSVVQAGITDVVVKMPANQDWKPVVQELENNGIRYMISVNSLAPGTEVVAVEPQSFRIPNLKGVFKLNLDLPNARAARVIIASQATGSLRFDRVINEKDGKITVSSETNLPSDHVLIAYPILQDHSIPDLWDKFDRHRDELLDHIRQAQLGPNFRGLINPMGKVSRFPESTTSSVPTSKYFRFELEEYLERKYGTAERAIQAWSLSVNGYTKFEELCNLVPLWSDARGIPYVWNTVEGTKTRVEIDRSSIWADIRTVLATTAERRYSRLVQSLESEINAPVIQEWVGWGGPYEQRGTVMSGIGYAGQVSSKIDAIDKLANPASTAMRRLNPAVCIATDLSLHSGEGSASPWDVIESSQEMGFRGWFFEAKTSEELNLIKIAASKSSELSGIDRWKTSVLYFPTSAKNPAATTRLPGGMWWLPSPAKGEQIDFGEGVEGYRYNDGAMNFVALWAKDQPRRMKFKVLNPSKFDASAVDGTDLEITVEKDHVEMYLPTSPVVVFDADDVPIPLDSFNITAAMSDVLITRFASIVDPTASEKYQLQQIMQGFDRNPTGAFIQLRKQWRKLLLKAAPYRWIEAEDCSDTNFSTVSEYPGASNNSALVLSSRMPSYISEFHARYKLQAFAEGEVTLWMAAKIPSGLLDKVSVSVAGRKLTFSEPPIAYYGDGFAWYKAGVLPVVPGEQLVTVQTGGSFWGEIVIDSLFASPDATYVPVGPRPPVTWLLDLLSKPEDPPSEEKDSLVSLPF